MKVLHFIFLSFFVFFSALIQAQDDWNVVLDGKVTESYRKLENASIVLIENGRIVDRARSNSSGKFTFILEFDKDYMIEVTKLGYIRKKISFSTKNVPKDKTGEWFPPFRLEVSIFKNFEGLNTDILEKPVGMIKYYNKKDNFDFDKAYTKQIQSQLARLSKEAEKLAEKEAEETFNAERIAEENANTTAEAKRKAEEEDAAAEAKRKAEEEDAAAEAKRKAEEEAAAEAKRKAQEDAAAEARRKAEEDAAAEAKRKAEEDAAAEAKRKAEEDAAAEAKRKAEDDAAAEAKRKAQEDAAAEAKRKAEEDAAAEAKRKAEEDAAAEAKRKAEEEAAAEAKRKAQEDAAAEARRKAQEDAAAEAKRKAEEEAAAEAKRKAEEEAAAEAKRKAEARKLADDRRRELEARERVRLEDLAKARAEQNQTAIDASEKDRISKMEEQEAMKHLSYDEKERLLSEIALVYPPGLTEETYTDGNKKIVRRIVVFEGRADDFKMVIQPWGARYYFKNGISITKSTFESETDVD